MHRTVEGGNWEESGSSRLTGNPPHKGSQPLSSDWGIFSTDSCLQWRKSLETAGAGISSRWGVWHTCRQIAFLRHWCKAGYRTQGSTAPAKPRLQKDGLCHHITGWAVPSCSLICLLLRPGLAQLQSAEAHKVGTRFLHCPLHPGAHGTWSCAQLASRRHAILPSQTEGKSCTSVKLLKRVRIFCRVTASNLGNFDQRKMMGAWW